MNENYKIEVKILSKYLINKEVIEKKIIDQYKIGMIDNLKTESKLINLSFKKS